ncbi:uncharacterized protein LOC105686340 isoform X2 [Athalia rosae]|uniref:uncharacterized protein LOC105686340 isoform X2 n=1 Tax=Athalia rosae TaxID=37344 RepID=UPI0020347C5A|nr:uncharacterized protein LOC105686340 isoform X2 [Athalia rosae]XP_012256461.2 uncharacterized protein LOC105686340 isoform X2 [Athalia rosae]XP_012256462.2 uncharacterized protein LOC105686340 isoform X2 [Athalia rosae]
MMIDYEKIKYSGGLIILLLGTCVSVTAGKNELQLSEVDHLRQELVEVDSELLQKLDIPVIASTPEMLSKSISMIVEDYSKFGDKLEEQFPMNRETHLDDLKSVWAWARSEIVLRGIDGLYTTFRRMQQLSMETHSPADDGTWRDFAETILNDPQASVPAALSQIFDLIVDEKLFISAYQEASGSICNDKQSPQQLLYNLYNSIAVTEIKGYAMIQFSWLLLRLYKQGNFTEEAELTKTKYETRMSETVKAVQTAMAFASQDLWKCDPTYPTPETYTELTSFLQSYVVNEVDLNSENTCRENCGYYNYAKVHSCFKNQYCSKQKRCNGKLYNCQYIDSDMWICPAEENSGRRYNYIEYENGRVFGQKGTCSRGTTKVDSWWRWLFWHCSYCVCFCDDHSHDSDRYFNLREVVADIESNKVITGIKFVKVNQVIHLQIEQGELLQRGRISNVTEWKPVDEYNVLDADLKEGLDYLTLSWDQRAIDLDDLTAAPGYLLTGIRFRSLGSHLNLEIMSTPFNFTTGVLVKPLEKSVWHGNDNTDASKPNPRTVLELNKPDRSTRSELQSLPDSKSDQYVLFSPSDLDKDAAQSTVPFIDTQAVTPYPRTPIAGAGIYHKGRSGFGGYIAPKLRTYNFAPHLHVDHTLSRPIIRIGENLIGKPMIN